MIPSDLIWGAVGLLLTVMILSYLIGDNLFFRLAAQLFVGLTAGYLVVLVINRIIVPILVTPLLTGTWIQRLWLLIPIVLTLLLIIGQVPRWSKLASLPLGFLAGLTAAVAIGGAVFGTLVPQSRDIIEAFDRSEWYAVPGQTWLRILDAVVMLIGTISTLSYFHFGRKFNIKNTDEAVKRPAVFEALGNVGQVFIGITLGAVFAGIFSSALVALIGRMSFIIQVVSRFLEGL